MTPDEGWPCAVPVIKTESPCATVDCDAVALMNGFLMIMETVPYAAVERLFASKGWLTA
jgi:hypothetical protein